EEGPHGAHRDRNAGWRREAGAQHGGAGREANLILSCRRTSITGPPVGGTFWFQIFIQAPSPEVWSKTISGAQGGCWHRSAVACFGPPPFEKIIGGVTAIVSYRPGGWMQQSTVPRCAILSVGSTGVTSSEAARVHIACRRRGCRMAARCGRAAAGYFTAPYRRPARRFVAREQGSEAVPARATRCRIFRRTRRGDRMAISQWRLRSSTGIGG